MHYFVEIDHKETAKFRNMKYIMSIKAILLNKIMY